MSLMGIDIGTTGCKASVFSVSGGLLSQAYREYDILRPRPGWQEIDSRDLWDKVKQVVAEVASRSSDDPIEAFAVSSFGEAMTPVSRDRRILGRCIVGLDERGQEYAEALENSVGRARLHAISGNIPSHTYSLPKLQWLRDHEPWLFDAAYKFLLCEDLVLYLMGCDPVTDYSLANRTMLFDLKTKSWSDELLAAAGLPADKLPALVSSGTVVGTIDPHLADELGLGRSVRAVTGGHDQCCNALGAGVVEPGMAVYGLGTFICITPVYAEIPASVTMLANGMNVEDHVVPGLYASFLYNGSGGSVLKWFRDNLARLDKERATAEGADVYDRLLAEMPEEPTGLMALPHFTPTGPPLFESRTAGVVAGLTLRTTRGELLKGLLEGVTYYFREGIEYMERAGIVVHEYRPTGGGAKSPVWLQLTADIMGKALAKPAVTEAGSLGACILAGVGSGVFTSVGAAVRELVRIERVYDPDPKRHAIYREKMRLYEKLYPALRAILFELAEEARPDSDRSSNGITDTSRRW